MLPDQYANSFGVYAQKVSKVCVGQVAALELGLRRVAHDLPKLHPTYPVGRLIGHILRIKKSKLDRHQATCLQRLSRRLSRTNRPVDHLKIASKDR